MVVKRGSTVSPLTVTKKSRKAVKPQRVHVADFGGGSSSSSGGKADSRRGGSKGSRGRQGGSGNPKSLSKG